VFRFVLPESMLEDDVAAALADGRRVVAVSAGAHSGAHHAGGV